MFIVWRLTDTKKYHAFAVVNWLKSSKKDYGLESPYPFGAHKTLSMMGGQVFACSEDSF